MNTLKSAPLPSRGFVQAVVLGLLLAITVGCGAKRSPPPPVDPAVLDEINRAERLGRELVEARE